MRRLAFVLLSSAIAACGSGGSATDSGPAVPDADPLAPDAAPPPPDAPPPPPDAAPIPDAAPAPDAWVQPAGCDTIPEGPFFPTLLTGFVPTEDLDFDDFGRVYESDTNHIYVTKYDGVREIFAPSVGFRAGMRRIPSGELIVNDDQDGAVARFDLDGTRTNLVFGLAYPNGLEIDQAGFAYVAEQSADRVIRIDPFTGDYTVLTDDEISNPNGLTFSPDYNTLYVGGFSGEAIIYRMDIYDDGTAGPVEIWKTGVGSGALDGMATDECGNVYVADYGQSKILRIAHDASTIDEIIETGTYMPNFTWGRGFGGWSDKNLYIVSVGNGIYEVDLGVLSKPRL